MYLASKLETIKKSEIERPFDYLTNTNIFLLKSEKLNDINMREIKREFNQLKIDNSINQLGRNTLSLNQYERHIENSPETALKKSRIHFNLIRMKRA